jgi:HEXXH motif-containing protein
MASDAARLRAEPPRDLTIPAPGSQTARRVLSAWLVDLVAGLGRLPLSRASVDAREDAMRALRSIHDLLAREPGALLGALRHTTVSAHLRTLLAQPTDVDLHLRTGLGQLAAELAVGGASFEPITLRRAPTRVIVRSAGISIPTAHARALRFAPGEIAIDGVPIDLERAEAAHLPIDSGISLALVDDNPLAMHEAHPDKEGNLLSLGERAPADWIASLRDALSRIARHLPDLHRDLELLLSQIVPVGFDPERHLSASYREAIGTIYLTLHPDPMTMTEAVVHEAQHTKLNALLAIDPLLENALEPGHTSPLRPDPRPLHGVLLAVHAFLPVALLYQQMRDDRDPLASTARFAARAAEVVALNRQGLDVLVGRARPTALGRALLDELQTRQEELERRAP